MYKILTTIMLAFALTSISCSDSIKGGYKGKVRLSGMIDNIIDGVKYSDKKHWSVEDESAIALVKPDGKELTVEFSDTDLLKNCIGLRENVPGQTCAVNIDGRTETLKFDAVHFTPASAVGPGGVMISIQGTSSPGGVFVDMLFSGVPYGKD